MQNSCFHGYAWSKHIFRSNRYAGIFVDMHPWPLFQFCFTIEPLETDSHKIAYLGLQSINLDKKKANTDLIGSALLQREVEEKKTKTLNLLLPYHHLIIFHSPA